MIYKNFQGIALSTLGMGCMRLPQKSENAADIDEAALAEMGAMGAALPIF